MLLLATLLILSLLVLPASYFFLCRKMKQAGIPNPPTMPFFCVFGTVGGFLLIIALNYFIGLLVLAFLLPFYLFAPISLMISLYYALRSKPQTAYHSGAIISCFILLGLMLLLILPHS
jgi:hypothetical protein